MNHSDNFEETHVPATAQDSQDSNRSLQNSPREQGPIYTHSSPEDNNNIRRSQATFHHIVHKTFLTFMNAAVTIFSMGLGVGIILGDSINSRTNVNSSSGSRESEIGERDGTHNQDRGNGSTVIEETDGSGIAHRSLVGVSRTLLPPQ